MIGIICAMNVELSLIKKEIFDIKSEKISSIDFYYGKIGGKDVVCAVCGEGKVNAAICTQTMILRFKPDLIVNTGVAGGLLAALNPTDIVVANCVVEHDMDITPLGEAPGYIHGIDTVEIPCDGKIVKTLCECVNALGIHCETGLIASGDQFINGGEKMEYIIKIFGAAAAEMEGGAVGHVCFQSSVPFAVLRSVSDKADSTSHMDFAAFTKIASKNSSNAILKFIEVY